MRFYDDPLAISTDTWVEVLIDRTVTGERDLTLLRLVYESENRETYASKIAPYLNYTSHAPVNSRVALFSKRVIKMTGAQPPLREDGSVRWWHVPFLGRDEKSGKCAWIMRSELVAACKQVFGQSDSELVYPGEVTLEDKVALHYEGAVKRIYVNRYEREKQARIECIEHYGCRCAVCGFDFEKVYGPTGQDTIHVHHLVPLSTIRKEYKIDPVRDLRPVCPNCHLIIHSRKEPFTIDEVKEQIRAGRGR
jgi:5-methylcytosine-specific restriction protein A